MGESVFEDDNRVSSCSQPLLVRLEKQGNSVCRRLLFLGFDRFISFYLHPSIPRSKNSRNLCCTCRKCVVFNYMHDRCLTSLAAEEGEEGEIGEVKIEESSPQQREKMEGPLGEDELAGKKYILFSIARHL